MEIKLTCTPNKCRHISQAKYVAKKNSTLYNTPQVRKRYESQHHDDNEYGNKNNPGWTIT